MHSAADGLSRKPRTRSDDIDDENDVDIDEFIAAELDCAQISWIGKTIRQGPVLGKVGIKAGIATSDHVTRLLMELSGYIPLRDGLMNGFQ